MKNIFLTLIFLAQAAARADLVDLEKEVYKEFAFINFPGVPFGSAPVGEPSQKQPKIDVAIIGAGMNGLAAAAALYQEGIYNIQLFDQAPEGLEGPWVTYAKMETLRTDKNEIGPALNIPSLTFQAWFTAQFGDVKFAEMDQIPTEMWQQYLNWYRKILELPVENECKLIDLFFDDDSSCLNLKFERNGEILTVLAQRVVLATGRAGVGGVNIPKFAAGLPEKSYAHTSSLNSYTFLESKRVAIIGAGASAFDAAAAALCAGAEKVTLLMRKSKIIHQNLIASFHEQCFAKAYFFMPDMWKLEMMGKILMSSVPPPEKSVKKVVDALNFDLKAGFEVQKCYFQRDEIYLLSSQDRLVADFLILATGFKVSLKCQPELSKIVDDICCWSNKFEVDSQLGEYPYLGKNLEFLPLVIDSSEDSLSYVNRIYCFNHAATLSHGAICRDITHLSKGAQRLAEGIAASFVKDQQDLFLQQLNLIDLRRMFESDFVKK